MEFFNQVSFLITGWILLVAIVSVLIALFSFLGTRTQKRLSNLEAGQARLETELKNNQNRFETELKEIKNNQNRFETELKEIKFKVDQILAKLK